MSIAYLTRKERFNAAHKLWVHDWSDDKNQEIFGKCANKNWHGHNYTLEVTVKGTPNEITGFIIDAKELSDIIKINIIEYLDHMNLNLDVPFISKNIQPTTENLVILIWKQLVDKIPDCCELYRIKLVETETISAEYYGE